MKLALGTVQFGLPYGVANSSGNPVDRQEVGEILNLAKKSRITTLDTAIAYGDSEKVLGEVGVKDWKIITKLPKVPLLCDDLSGWVFAEIERSLGRLKLGQLYGVLLHHPQDLTSKNGSELAHALEKIKSEGLAQKIGVSLYEPDQLVQIENQMSLDLVQAPASIFDRRFIDSGCLNRLKAQGIEFHARSIFLQGLLLMNRMQRPKFFQQFAKTFKRWDAWINEQNISPMQACLGYMNDIHEIDRVVVGVETTAQLSTILSYFKSQDLNYPPFVDTAELNLLNPALWRNL